MPHPVLVFVAVGKTTTQTFHFGTVTPLLYLTSCICYLSGNIRLTYAYSGRNGTRLLFRRMQHLLSQ